MRRAKRSYELDMTHGRLIPRILAFAFPLMITSMLQLLYNAADVIVVGQFAGKEAQAAVGSTGALINLIVNVFLGLSIGTNVVVAKYYGARDYKGTQETVHTAITISVIGGFVLAVFGYLFGGTFLEWMGSNEDVLPLATKYIKIFFLGMPFNMLYNFGAAILRAVGDTKRPFFFLMISGLINVGLNMIFVIGFGMDVDGVAWATIISQMVSAVLVVFCLIHTEGFVHLNPKRLKIHKDKLGAMARVGLPAGLQGACFSISNVLIQSTINAYPTTVVAGNSTASNLEGFIYVAMNAFHQAAVTFTSANVGAGRHSRIRKVMGASTFLVTAVGMAFGLTFFALRYVLLGIYSPDPEVVMAATVRFNVITLTYWMCGIMDVLCGVMRGMGAALMPMIVAVTGACAFRIFWIYAILPMNNTLSMLYYSYPVSWILTSLAHFACYLIWRRRFPVDLQAEAQLDAAEQGV